MQVGLARWVSDWSGVHLIEKDHLIIMERQSEIATRSEPEKQLVAERRAGTDQRMYEAEPSGEQLALFVRRIRRVMRDERGRHLLGVAIGEGHFTAYPDVVRVLAWIEQMTGCKPQPEGGQKPSLRRARTPEAT